MNNARRDHDLALSQSYPGHWKGRWIWDSGEPYPFHDFLMFRRSFELPAPAAGEKRTVLGKEYTLTFRGSTLVDIAPRDTTPGRYRYYLRDEMKGGKAPMQTVERFVAERLIGLQ